MKRKLIISFIIIFTLVIFGVSALAYFFIANEAPVIKGEVIHHVNYKEELSLDIYLPTNEVYVHHPVLLFFHGGGWIGGSKGAININRVNGSINQLREKGYAVISVDYSLASSDQSAFPHCIIDAYDAIKWVEDHAAKYDFDTQNVGLMGESAGAHISMMAAYAKVEGFSPNSKSNIDLKYVVDIYGPTHLDSLYHSERPDSLRSIVEKMPEGLRDHLTEQIFGFDPEEDSLRTLQFMYQYSPITYVHKEIPPTLIIHGQLDKICPLMQSEILQAKLEDLNIDHEYHVVENMHHAFNGASEEQKEEVQTWIVDFVEKQYQKYP